MTTAPRRRRPGCGQGFRQGSGSLFTGWRAASGRSSGSVRKGVLHQGVTPAGAGPVEPENVETAGRQVKTPDRQVQGGGAGEAAAPGPADGRNGGPPSGGGARPALRPAQGPPPGPGGEGCLART